MHRLGSSWSLGITTLAPFIAAAVVESDDADIASSRLSMAVAALLVLAGVIAVSTIVFWRMTKPDSLNVGEVGIRWIQPEQADTPAGAGSPATVTPAAPEQRSLQRSQQRSTDTPTARSSDPQQTAPRGTNPDPPTRVPPASRAQPTGRPAPTERPMVRPDPVDG